MKLKIKEIVLVEERPFCFADFKEFEICGEKYKMDHGTFRNNILRLKKAGDVELAFKSKPAFYTIPGKKFTRTMTHDHTGVPNVIINPIVLKQTPIYKWIKNRPFSKQALHNIRLTFEANGIWDIFSRVYSELIEPNSQDIKLQPLIFFGYIDVTISIHHSNTVSIAISCSCRPIATDTKDIIQLFEALIRTEVHIASIIDNYCRSNDIQSPPFSNVTTIPSCRKWIVKMWHFGVDSIDEYSGKEFHVTFEEGMADLVRIYTKRMEDNNNNKQKVRVERQEYPNQEAADAFVQKLFPGGNLVDPAEVSI